MGHITHEGMLIRRMDLHREAKLPDNRGTRLVILIEHMDGTDYTLYLADKEETPEYLTALLTAVARGADMMIRAFDALRAIGYVDVRPVALAGRHIIFGLDRIALGIEIREDSNGELECYLGVTGEDQENVEAIKRVLEKKGIGLI